MLSEYLPAFTTAAHRKSPRTLYLDLFAGDHENLSRTTREVIIGSPGVALDAEPPFAKTVLFELPAQAARLEAQLRTDFPNRDLEVVPGDCNETVPPTLLRLKREQWDWAPTFALVDQYAAEVRWSTLQQIARFKRSETSKAELWLLFAHSMLPRGLASDDVEAVERFSQRITAMYGTDRWRDPYRGRQLGIMGARELREQLLNLMRWRIEKELGYRATHAFEMKNTQGGPLYSMVLATDHDAGERIMRHIYGGAAEAQPRMQAEAAAKLRGEGGEEGNLRSVRHRRAGRQEEVSV